jgi:hypothetical protein
MGVGVGVPLGVGVSPGLGVGVIVGVGEPGGLLVTIRRGEMVPHAAMIATAESKIQVKSHFEPERSFIPEGMPGRERLLARERMTEVG